MIITTNYNAWFSAVIIAKPLRELVRSVHLTNTERRRAAVDFWTYPIRLTKSLNRLSGSPLYSTQHSRSQGFNTIFHKRYNNYNEFCDEYLIYHR